MVIHTVVPMELVMEQSRDAPKRKEIMLSGVKCEVEMASETSVKIVRLISSDPDLYLEPQWQPGYEWQLTPDRGAR